jgi:signal transduction histidine kinase
MQLADFILCELERIVSEWEAFAALQFPAARKMTPLALRDHAEQILRAIAKDLAAPQTRAEQMAKSRGEAAARAEAPETGAQTHGLHRAKNGFDINQMASEYRALRASVLRLWMDACAPQAPDMDDIVRFNEAIDQALAESIFSYSGRVEQARNLFLGMLGHDMRTPLQAIHMTGIYLDQLNAGEKVSEAASRLIRSGAHMQSLLEDLVEFNRINLGLGIPVDRQPCDVGKLFADEVAELEAAHPDRRIELVVNGSGAGSWDGLCLQRLLVNLVVNAIKYGSQGTPVRVIVTGQEQEVVVEVHNEGLPIEPSMLESLFDPLRRGLHHDAPDRRNGSLGLGLHIARGIAQAHGGEIEAHSDRIETVFTARLPREARA